VSARERRKGRAQTTARELPGAIQWHEGMLLAPQHFQWLSLRQESLLQYHAAAISPFHWGVRHLEIDRVLQVDGILRIVELEAVMPDGLVVSHTSGEVPDLSVELTSRTDEMKHRPLMVHLAVTARGREKNAFADRYGSVDAGPVADENTGEGGLPMPVLKPKLSLVVADDLPEKYVGFPLVEVAHRNEVFTQTEFEPPWLRVGPGSATYQLCLSIAARLREKAVFLADQARTPSMAASAEHLLETKLLVHCLAGELPAFEAILRTGVSHPFPLYVSLCSLVGHVAGLGRSLVPPVLDPYDHNNLQATFAQARAFIDRAVSEGVHEAYTRYALNQERDEYRIVFDPDWTTRTLILGVQAPSGVSDQEMGAWIEASVIAGASSIASRRDLRVTGLRRKRIDADKDLVPPRGMSLYSLSIDTQYLTPGEDLVVINPATEGQHRPESIVLFVRNAM
jgi:type VI secretion system protein ImpJ